MAINYSNIFLNKTGQMDSSTPWEDTRITTFLDASAFITSRSYATPWGDFDSVPEQHKYAVVLLAALDYWYAKAGEASTKFDVQAGGQIGQKSSSMFDRALKMISKLEKEFEKEKLVSEGSGDIIMGDLMKRSKQTGYLVPRAEDTRGDWTS